MPKPRPPVRPQPPLRPEPPPAANANELRNAIDSGRTHDKVRAPDPAAAPRTDEEAARMPTLPREFGAAIGQESADPRLDPPQRRTLPFRLSVWPYVTAGVILAVVLLFLFA